VLHRNRVSLCFPPFFLLLCVEGNTGVSHFRIAKGIGAGGSAGMILKFSNAATVAVDREGPNTDCWFGNRQLAHFRKSQNVCIWGLPVAPSAHPVRRRPCFCRRTARLWSISVARQPWFESQSAGGVGMGRGSWVSGGDIEEALGGEEGLQGSSGGG